MSYNWNKNKCMSSKNSKSIERCNRKIILNSDFCKYHCNSKIYNIKALDNIRKINLNNIDINIRKITFELKKLSTQVILNESIDQIKNKIKNNTDELNNEHSHKLMSLKDNWNVVPYFNRIKLSDGWWDVHILINHITSQLNKSEMENPYPIYPSSPFTRIQYTVFDIYTIKEFVIKLNIPVNIALNCFLLAPLDKHKKFFNDSKCCDTNFSHTLLNYFKENLRFKLMNRKNSQSCFTGYWVNKTEDNDYFEKLYNRLNNTPMEVYFPGIGYVFNSDREIILTIMNSINEDNWGTTNDHTIVFLK